MQELNLVELSRQADSLNNSTDVLDDNFAVFSDNELAELAGLYAKNIVVESNKNMDEIKKLILEWNAGGNSFLGGQIVDEITEQGLENIQDINQLEELLKTVIYQYLNQSLLQRKSREKELIDKINEINGIRLSTARLLEDLNRNQDLAHKKLIRIQKINNLQKNTVADNGNVGNNSASATPTPPLQNTNTNNKNLDSVKQWAYSGQNNLKDNSGFRQLWPDLSLTNTPDNIRNIYEKLQTKGFLTKINEIKDLDGNVILKGIGETPFIHKNAAANLIGLALDYRAITKSPLILDSAFRTTEHQKRLLAINKSKGIPTNQPGNSRHNVGIAIDVDKQSRYNTKLGGINGFRVIAKKNNFAKISSEDRHFEHIPMRTQITKVQRINASKIVGDSYNKDRLNAA